ncbi:MAG: TonB-dependent receptor [Chitinophagales bacterium]|nr:TonB-dependent receptor [Chitinophagales bacterium]
MRRSRGSVYHATNDSLKTVEVYNLSHIRFEHDLSVYNRVINDWILWFGGAIWTPHNISQVHSRGLQTENALKYVVNKNLEFKLGVNGSYTLATTMSSYIPNDGSIGKQIPYTPRFMAQSNIGFKWKDIYLNYNHTYTGVRYITTDESYGLKEYTLGNIQLLYAKDVQGHILQLTAQCNNVWNSEYVVVNARPMRASIGWWD